MYLDFDRNLNDKEIVAELERILAKPQIDRTTRDWSILGWYDKECCALLRIRKQITQYRGE